MSKRIWGEEFHPWDTAARMLSGRAKELPHLGTVEHGSGWKVARLIDTRTGRWRGLAFGEYSSDEKATCAFDREHKSPNIGCECGFHAVGTREAAINLMEGRRGVVLLQVELYGEIVVHTKGMRAEEQVVLAMYVPKWCTKLGCRNETAGMREGRRSWLSRCSNHLENGATLQELRRQLGLEVATL